MSATDVAVTLYSALLVRDLGVVEGRVAVEAMSLFVQAPSRGRARAHLLTTYPEFRILELRRATEDELVDPGEADATDE